MFTTMVINVLEWSVAEILTKAGTLSYVGVEKIYSKLEGGLASSGSDKFEISTGVPYLRF